SRGALARALLTESLMLSCLGASTGALVAWMSIDFVRSLLPQDFPRLAAVGMNGRILGVTVLVALGVGATFGLVPILRLTRGAAQRFLAQNQRAVTVDRGATVVRNVLATTEVALATLLLLGAVLFLTSFGRVSRIDIGFNYRDVLTVRLRPLVLPG